MKQLALEEEIDAETTALLSRYAFDADTFSRLRGKLAAGELTNASNRIAQPLAPPLPGDVLELPGSGSSERATLEARGLTLLAEGRVGVVILAGGMATRFGGVVKAAVEALPGHSFLELKLRDIDQMGRRARCRIPVYLMSSFATDRELARMAGAARYEWLEVSTFAQFISLRLTSDGALFRDETGKLSPYAPGHGDLVPALRRAGALSSLRSRGVELLFMSNVDNLAATLDPAVIAAHAEGGGELTFEVAELYPGDKGGVPARLDGRLQVIEALRYPEGFVEQSIPLFSTNSFVMDARAIDRPFALDWFRVEKKVGGRTAIQFERFVNQLTAFVEARALSIARAGAEGRFLPVKDPDELSARRGEIELVLRARRVL